MGDAAKGQTGGEQSESPLSLSRSSVVAAITRWTTHVTSQLLSPSLCGTGSGGCRVALLQLLGNALPLLLVTGTMVISNEILVIRHNVLLRLIASSIGV